jgi:hypothetical protein
MPASERGSSRSRKFLLRQLECILIGKIVLFLDHAALVDIGVVGI